MKLRTGWRWLNVLVLVALLPGYGLSAAPTPAQVPEAGPADLEAPPVSAPEVTPPESAPPDATSMETAPVTSNATQASTTCSAPATVPFGRDLELMIGPNNSRDNYAITTVNPTPSWETSTSVSTWITGTTYFTPCVDGGPGPKQVNIYKDANYGGTCATLDVGEYPDSLHIGIGNDELTSLKVGENVQVLLCKDANYGGTCATLPPGEYPNSGYIVIGNDTLTSAKVTLKPHVTAYAAVPMGTDDVLAIVKTGSSDDGDLAVQKWTPGSTWSDLTYLGLSTDASPAAASRTPENYSIVAQSGGTLKSMHGDANGPSMSWQDVPGGWDDENQVTYEITDATGTPAVVSTGPYQLTLFYRTTGGGIRFSEWRSGYGWRQTPITLTLPTGTALKVDPVAVARDENHIAVFVVVDDRLYVREWSNANESDWSDTTWTALTETGTVTVKSAPPAVASRHNGNISVAFLSTGNNVWTMQWGPDGWGAPTSNVGILESLNLTALSADEMMMYGVRWDDFFASRWTRSSGRWGGWQKVEDFWASSPAPVGVSSRMHEMTVVGRNSSDSFLQAKPFTARGDRPTMTTVDSTANGTPRSQAIANLDARTYWVSAYRVTSDEKWHLVAKDTTTWTGYSKQLSNHPDADTSYNKVSVTVGDVNQDGDDEIIVATLNEANTEAQVSVLQLVVSSGKVTDINSLATKTFSLSGSTFTDINVAVGNLANTDLTGVAVADEILVAAIRNGYDQVRLGAYRYSSSGLDTLEEQTVDVANDDDLELAVARLDSGPTEKIVLGVGGSLYQYRYYKYYTDRFVEVDDDPPSIDSGGGAYGTAMASGDVDADGLEEVVYVAGSQVIVYPNGPTETLPFGWQRSLAVGDINMDGLAEIVYNDMFGTRIVRLSHRGAQQSLVELNWLPGVPGVPLLADTDGDSLVASYRDCYQFGEAQVVTVANGQPQWYPNYQYAVGNIFATDENNNETGKAWTTSLGGGVTASFEQEVSFIVELAKVSSSIAFEFAGSVGQSTSQGESLSVLTDSDFWGETVRGKVCYVHSEYTCYNYSICRPGSTVASTALACSPPSSPSTAAPQKCVSINDWYSQDTVNTYGASWVPVGHGYFDGDTFINTLDLTIDGNYEKPASGGARPRPPVDPYVVWWDGYDSRIDVGPTSLPGEGSTGWEVERGKTRDWGTQFGFETSLTTSAGAGAAGFMVEWSTTVGYSQEWNRSVSWSKGLGFSGRVYDYDVNCAYCAPYTVAPYVYLAQAETEAGARYTYLEQDYYITRWGPLNAALGAAPARAPSAPSVMPQAPVVTSTTHPDANTWYTDTTVAFAWSQPAGDPAVLTGYMWAFNTTPVYTPTAPSTLTTTHTYLNVPDGTYYLHIRADAGDWKRGPVTHRQVKVDSHAPQVTLAADPSLPTAFSGWYNTPVAVSVTATDTVGSGVDSVEYSTDGTTWLDYGAPINIAADTAGDTLWARATDNVGYTSEPVSTTVKLDTAAPSTYDSDGYGLSYASIITDEVGNAQLVLGGALSDALSGRLQVEVKAGNTGLWHTVSAVGDLPVPPDNWFTTTMPSLQWIYTPTFDVRGVYPLWARGVDAAGNYEPDWIHGVFWWEPDDVPVLIESQVSVSPRQVHPGDVAAFTIGARNSGYQEASLLVTDTVPGGLTIVADSISDGGQYNADTRVITWTLDALWPGQMRYVSFSAVADSTATTSTLENQVDLVGYWPWDKSLYGVPPEPARHHYSATTTLTVLPSAGQSAAAVSASSAPRVLNLVVEQGTIVSDRQVALIVQASSDTHSLYVKEWIWDGALNAWNLAAESGWVPFQAGPGFELTQDASGKSGRYTWTLSEGDGVKYLGVWVADANGEMSNLNEGNLVYTSLVSANGQQLTAGQRVQYRIAMHTGDLALLNLVSLSGDADLYIWKPRAGFMPNYYSNATLASTGLSIDTVGFFAPEGGMYVIEVEAATDAYYRLVTAGSMAMSGASLAETQVDPALASLTEGDLALLEAQDEVMGDAYQALAALHSTHLSLDEKDRPAHPLTLSTPYSLADAGMLPGSPLRTQQDTYLPLVFK